MNVNTMISRGMERLLVARAGERLEGMFGLAGFGTVDTFGALAGLLDEAGFVGTREHVAKLRRTHGAMCRNIRAALPVAVDAKALMEATGGDLSGIFDKVKKLAKKAVKIGAKLSPSHQLIKKVAPKALAFSPSQIAMTAASAKKAKATPEAVAARAQAKADKKAAKAAKKAAKAAAALQAANATNLDPAAAAAAVLASQSGVPLQSPEAQAFAQDLVQSAGGGGSGGGGGMVPYTGEAAPTDAAADGTIFGLEPWVVGVGAVVILGGGYLLMRKRRG